MKFTFTRHAYGHTAISSCSTRGSVDAYMNACSCFTAWILSQLLANWFSGTCPMQDFPTRLWCVCETLVAILYTD
jgi:hypothetical protein